MPRFNVSFYQRHGLQPGIYRKRETFFTTVEIRAMNLFSTHWAFNAKHTSPFFFQSTCFSLPLVRCCTSTKAKESRAQVRMWQEHKACTQQTQHTPVPRQEVCYLLLCRPVLQRASASQNHWTSAHICTLKTGSSPWTHRNECCLQRAGHCLGTEHLPRGPQTARPCTTAP